MGGTSCTVVVGGRCDLLRVHWFDSAGCRSRSGLQRDRASEGTNEVNPVARVWEAHQVGVIAFHSDVACKENEKTRLHKLLATA